MHPLMIAYGVVPTFYIFVSMPKNSNLTKIIKELTADDIIKRIYIEARREVIRKKAQRALENLKKRKVKRGTQKDLFKDLEND